MHYPPDSEPRGLELRAIHVFIREYLKLSDKIDVDVNADSASRAVWIFVEAGGRRDRRPIREAARAVIEFGFQQLSLNRIVAYAMTKNPASSRVMEKIGMTYEGTFPQHVRKWDDYEDLVAYGIVRSAEA